MQFKHPEILYFLFILFIPILVHLFQLRRFKKEYFTNVQFLKELSIQTRKSSKIKKWLLLATRLLLLAFLILAFAQPFFKSKDSKNANNEMYIVLDNSFSMQAKGQKGELLKRAVQELLEEIPENMQFSLITNNETFWNSDIKSLQKDLQNLKYSATPFVLDNLMAKIKARKSAFNKDIVVITDAVGLEEKQTKSINKDYNTYFIIPKAEQKNNVAIDSVYISQNLENFYEIGVKLSDYGNESKNIPIALYNQNKLVAKTLVNFEEKTKTINFTIPKSDFHGYVNIQDKGLDYDNSLYFSISKPEKTNVFGIGESGKSGFLSRIYTNDEFNFNNFEINSLDYNSIEKQDAIVLNEIKDIPQALQTTLKAFVEKGGSVIVIPSQECLPSNMNGLLANFGSVQYLNTINTEKLITKINFSHPIFASVFEKKIYNFQYPNTRNSFEMKSNSGAILSYEDQSPFLISMQNELSSVYVFSAAINKTNSNFQNSPLIVPVFYKMAQNSQKSGINALTIGDENPFLIDALLGKDEIIEIKNADSKFVPTQQILNSKVKMTFNDNPEIAGNFGTFSKDKLLKNISFNYARTESNLDLANENAVSDFKIIDSIGSVFDKIHSDRTDNNVWKIFLFLTLLFLVIEMLIQKFVK
jgi:Aerotolerance regulator N-terminal